MIITYAADWSEYHHTDGGWYNLDELWSSRAIDVIGIDAYFPITDTNNSSISTEDIKKGWRSGEGWDFYRDGDKTHPLSPDWAWKNIHHWWSNLHRNPDGSLSPWKPKSKKIWFTEYGFPSIDKGTNQPNVFYNPDCIDGGLPRLSNGRVDFGIQRKAIKASLEYFKELECLENTFLWTWDARPYPAWPHRSFWRDGSLWSRGHWVNNKFGASSLGGIITKLCEMAGIHSSYIDVGGIDEIVSGMVINQEQSATQIINTLRCAYLFDLNTSSNGVLKFTKRETGVHSIKISIKDSDLIKINDSSYTQCSYVHKGSMLDKVIVNFVNQLYYSNGYHYFHLDSDSKSNLPTEKLDLPIMMTEVDAEVMACQIIKISQSEIGTINFRLSIEYNYLEPTNIITVSIKGAPLFVRITDIKRSGIKINFTGILLEDNLFLDCLA